MGELFYTGDQKKKLRSISEDSSAKRKPLSEAMGAAILDALGEQQNAIVEILEEIRGLNSMDPHGQFVKSGRAQLEKLVRALSDETIEEIEGSIKSIWG